MQPVGNCSQDVIDLHADTFGGDYRLQTDGEHPIGDREKAAVGRNGGAR